MSKRHKICSLSFLISIFLFAIPLSATANTYSHNRQMSPRNVAYCRTTECILSCGFSPAPYSYFENNKYIVCYKNSNAQRGGAYALRQGGHLVMCLATGGLWEIAMEPIEKSAGNIVVKATYPNKHSHFVEKIEIRGNY